MNSPADKTDAVLRCLRDLLDIVESDYCRVTDGEPEPDVADAVLSARSILARASQDTENKP